MTRFGVDAGDVVEFTLHGTRRTATVMLVSETGSVLLDLAEEDVLAWSELDRIEDLAVYRPDVGELWVAA
jgi:hypothetical protein